jgi:hypothetical protein
MKREVTFWVLLVVVALITVIFCTIYQAKTPKAMGYAEKSPFATETARVYLAFFFTGVVLTAAGLAAYKAEPNTKYRLLKNVLLVMGSGLLAYHFWWCRTNGMFDPFNGLGVQIVASWMKIATVAFLLLMTILAYKRPKSYTSQLLSSVTAKEKKEDRETGRHLRYALADGSGGGPQMNFFRRWRRENPTTLVISVLAIMLALIGGYILAFELNETGVVPAAEKEVWIVRARSPFTPAVLLGMPVAVGLLVLSMKLVVTLDPEEETARSQGNGRPPVPRRRDRRRFVLHPDMERKWHDRGGHDGGGWVFAWPTSIFLFVHIITAL